MFRYFVAVTVPAERELHSGQNEALSALDLVKHREMSPPAFPFDLPLCITGFKHSLEFLKKSRVCPAIFQTWEKSGRIVKGLDYYFFYFFFLKATVS